ncbi:MAG: hypothetical protein QMD86_00040 [Patescibacteria group bacterium]|nr:hypothetical protein [Patescibacteria group bacterium]
MKENFKIVITFIISTAVFLSMYYGSYLPLRKSQMHIDAVLSLQNGRIRTVGELNGLFDPVLNFNSPVGQDEITQYYLGILANVINQQSDRTVVDVLTRQAESRMTPILEKEKGFNFNQNLYTLGSIYKIVAIKFKDEGYYQKGVNMFQKGLGYSPNRLIFLEGLFDLYSAHGYNDKANEMGKIILKYWPNNEKVKSFVNSK